MVFDSSWGNGRGGLSKHADHEMIVAYRVRSDKQARVYKYGGFFTRFKILHCNLGVDCLIDGWILTRGTSLIRANPASQGHTSQGCGRTVFIYVRPLT
jgi:hypothetical protein